MTKKTDSTMRRWGFRYRYLRNDTRTGALFATLSFPTGAGHRDEIEVAPSVLFDKNLLLRELRNRDAILPSNRSELEKLVQAIGRAKPKQRLAYSANNGWSLDRTWFAIDEELLGAHPRHQLGTRGSAHAAGEPGQLGKKGLAKEWRNSVGKLAENSSVCMLCICAALAAPLLAFTGRPSFAIVLVGRTRAGKTMGSLCGASLTGIGRAQDLVGWRSTDTSIEERLTDFIDIMFVLDDISAMEGSQADKYDRLSKFAYMLASDQGKARGRTYKAATNTTHSRHRTIVVTSAETSIFEMARRVRRERLGGEALRLIELPAMEPGQVHIFDRSSKDGIPLRGEEWLRRTFKKLARACRRYYGAAFRHYLRLLIPLRSRLQKRVSKLVAEFVGHTAEAVPSPEAHDLAEKFGLLFAGGVLGADLGIVPWKGANVLEAVATCYRRARRLLNDDAEILRRALVTLHGHLRNLPRHAPKRNPAMDFEVVDGYRSRRKGREVFVVKADAFSRLFAGERERSSAVQWLLRHDGMSRARGKKAANEAKPKSQLKWPDNRRRRSYQIVWPENCIDEGGEVS